jgi:hypothetical protein
MADVTYPALYLPDGDGYVATLATQGGWNPAHQHGSPSQALLARAVEQTPSLVPMQVVRLTHDLFRAVPIGPRLTVSTEIVRDGKRIQVVEAVMRDGDLEIARTRALRLRIEDLTGLPGLPPVPDLLPSLPSPQSLETAYMNTPAGSRPGFLDGMELRRFPVPEGPEGSFGFWVRLLVPLVPDEVPTPLVRLSIAGDFCNMIGAVYDATHLTAINPDLNVHVLGLPAGEWVAVTGDTRIGLATGMGLSGGYLRDEDGSVVGLVSNCQLIQRR